jgi:SAM-dependent methyltransferase
MRGARPERHAHPRRPSAHGVAPAVHAYGTVVSAYETGRPGYPPEAISWIVSQSGADGRSRILDLAAGTGKLTRLLLPIQARIVSVEPVPAFREALAGLPVEVRDGLAEKIPLPSNSVDLVTVGSAFHWFDAECALAEIRRVLRPTRMLAILWNERDPRDETQRALTKLLEPHRRDEPRQADEHWVSAFTDQCGFGPLSKRDFPHPHPFTADSLVSRIASVSFVARLSELEREDLLARVRGLAARRGSRFDLPHITHVYLAQALTVPEP